MHIKPLLVSASLSLALLSPYLSKAQFGGFSNTHMDRVRRWGMADMAQSNPESYRKMAQMSNHLELFGGVNLSKLYIEGQYNVPDGSKPKKFTKELPMKMSYALGGSVYFPMSKIGEKSSLGINVGINAMFYKNDDRLKIGINVGDTLTKYEITTTGIPISLDYKVGCDARYDRAYKPMFGIGIGFNPMFSTVESNFHFINGDYFKLAPFIKAEVGYYLGIGMKLRVMYTYINSFNNYEENTPENNPDNVKAKGVSLGFKGKVASDGCLTIGLSLYPFAAMWDQYVD